MLCAGRFGCVGMRILGARIDGLTLEQFAERISRFVDRGEPCFVVTLNPELLYRAQYQKDLLDVINQAHLVTADGIGVVWACRVGGQPVPERVTGIDLMMRLLKCAADKGWRVFFLGSAPGVAEAAAGRAVRLFSGLRVAGTDHGYFADLDSLRVIERIKGASPHLLFVAMGSPRQERWIHQHMNRLGNIVSMGVGGSLDVLSERVRRPPDWMRSLGLEWLGRLLIEPGRWRRMLVLPKFALMVMFKYRLKGKPGG